VGRRRIQGGKIPDKCADRGRGASICTCFDVLPIGKRISILGTVERKLISGSFKLVYMYAEVSACNKEMYYQLRRDSGVVINGPCYRLPRSTLDTSTLRVSSIIGWLCPTVLHPEYTHRCIEHLGQTHNHPILLVCDIVRRVPLTLMHPAHPALQSEHQGPIRESACSTTSPSSWPCRKQLLTKRWNHMFTLPPPQARARACKADEESQYHTAYKQSEHRPPRLIRERVNKTPGAILRMALTSILRIN